MSDEPSYCAEPRTFFISSSAFFCYGCCFFKLTSTFRVRSKIADELIQTSKRNVGNEIATVTLAISLFYEMLLFFPPTTSDVSEIFILGNTKNPSLFNHAQQCFTLSNTSFLTVHVSIVLVRNNMEPLVCV